MQRVPRSLFNFRKHNVRRKKLPSVRKLRQRFHNTTHGTARHRTAPLAFSIRQKRRAKVDNTRACGSQRRAAGVPQAIRTTYAASRQVRSC